MLAVLYASFAPVVYGTIVTVDFNADDAGNALFEGNADSGGSTSGINVGVDQPYANLFSSGSGITFSSSTNLITLYDTDGTGGLDDDLEAPFIGGNGNQTGGYGNALILQTTDTNQPASSGNNVNAPNDNATGGELIINSGLFLDSFAFSFIDLDNTVIGGVASTITFTDTTALTNGSVTITFAQLESDPTFGTSGVDFGNRHANDISVITIADLQTVNSSLTQFDQITIDTSGSGALGEFTFNTVIPAIPEPSSSVLIALGAVSFILRRRR